MRFLSLLLSQQKAGLFELVAGYTAFLCLQQGLRKIYPNSGMVHSIAFVCQLNLLFGQALEKNPHSQGGCGELAESALLTSTSSRYRG